MSNYVLRTLRPLDTEHTIYYRFDSPKTCGPTQKQATKRPIQQQNTDQETETKAKKYKQSTKRDSGAKLKASTSAAKKTPTTKEQKATKYTFI